MKRHWRRCLIRYKLPQIWHVYVVNGIVPLLLSVIFMMLIWQITQVRFSPVEGSISLHEAILYTDVTGQCKDSIPDSLLTDDVVEESLPQVLLKCVKNLEKTGIEYSRSVQIPHEWYKDIKEYPEIKSGKALYHFEVQFDVGASGLWAIVLPTASQNTAVFLNGILLGWGGSFEKPVARNATRPQIFTIPDGKFRKGLNEVDIYVVSQPARKGFLDKVYIAPIEMLKPAFNDFRIFRYTLSWIISLTMAVLSLFMFILWKYRRQEAEYGLFALSGFFWVIHTLNQFVVDIPFSAKLWDGIIYASAGLLALTSVFFIHRLLNRSYPKREKALLITAFVLAILMLILPTTSGFFLGVFRISVLMEVVVAIYIFFVAVTYAFKVKKIEWYALALAIGVVAVFAVFDLMIVLEFRPLYKGQLLHFAAPFILLSFAWILLQRFVKTLEVSEKYNLELKALNQDLENRVEARGRKIRQSYETIRLLGQEQILLNERSRIMRDMHDGIGVYLTSMLRHLERDTIDKKQLSESAQNALNDLRLMIDSLGRASTDLPAMLGMFRARISVALKACGIELVWHVEELPPVKDFGPERALNLLRILQEAFTNALKHSEANSILLSAYSEPFGDKPCLIKIEIVDNGKGFNSANANGNGLKNMQYRARKIKADLHIDTSKEGTRLTIILPLSTNKE